MKYLTPVLIVIQLASLGCGGGASPTPPTPRSATFESTSEGPLPAQSVGCVPFRQGTDGAASASLNQRLPIEIGAGSCNGGTASARGEGEVTGQLPTGDSFVRFQNTSDTDTRYRVVIRYLVAY